MTNQLSSLLLHFQVRPCPLDVSSPDQVSSLHSSNPLRYLTCCSGAQIVFHSFLQPVLGRFFNNGSTSANLRAQAEAAAKSQ